MLGVLLVLGSVLLGARVVGAADATVPVWAVDRDLAAGTELTADDLVAVDVRLDDAAGAYLSTGTRPEGRTLARAVRAGELLPRSALEEPAELVQLALPVQSGYVPPGLRAGPAGRRLRRRRSGGGRHGGGRRQRHARGRGRRRCRRISGRSEGVLSTPTTAMQVVVAVAADDAPDVLAAIGGRPLVVVVHDSVDARDAVRARPSAHRGGAGRLMALQVFTAVTGAAWESELVGALDRADHGVTVVRRCVDVSELLAVAATGTGQAALLSAELRRLDGDAVARLEAAGVAVVGLVEPGDERAAERLRQLGVRRVLPADAEPEAIAAGPARGGGRRPAAGPGRRRSAGRAPGAGRAGASRRSAGRAAVGSSPCGVRPGRPGRTTVAVGIADEAARLGRPTLLVDADVYGGVVAQVLGLLDESPGLAGAARLAGGGHARRRGPGPAGVGGPARTCGC